MENKQNLKTAVDRRLSGVKVTEQHIRQVLDTMQPRRFNPRAVIIAFALVALLGTGLAMNWPATVSWIQGMFGEEWAGKLQSGTLMNMQQIRVLGQVQYEWLEVIHVGEAEEKSVPYFYEDNSLYGTVRIRPVQGANIVLIPEDTELTMFPGYNRHLGELAPEGAPTYLELAAEKNAKIILAKAVPQGALIGGKLQEDYEIMYDYSSQPDGSLLYHFQIPQVPASQAYTIRLRLNNWEITKDGQWLRGEPHDTWLKDDWEVTVQPGQ